MLKTDWSDIHETNNFNIFTIPLAVMSVFYRLGLKADQTIKKARQKALPGFVMSIGNITSGGTGKTPAAIMIAEWAKSQGYNTVVLSRGYGGKYKEKTEIVSDGKSILMTPEKSGDEPWLIANALKDIPVVVSRERYQAGLKAIEKFNSNFFILDDGFQHIHLKRDMDIVLADAKRPFGNGHLLPWGPLREPLTGLRRADAILFTRSKNRNPERHVKNPLKIPVFKGDHEPVKVVFPGSDKTFDLSYLKGKRVAVFSGIARPKSFKEMLLNLGANVVSFKAFGDHYAFKKEDIANIRKEYEKHNGDILITTEKDWARIKGMSENIESLACLAINFVITSGKDDFFRMIKEKAEKVL